MSLGRLRRWTTPSLGGLGETIGETGYAANWSMKVPDRIEDSRVLYYVPLAQPESNGPDEPKSVAYALIEWFAWNRYRKEPSRHSQLCSIGLDVNGAPIWTSENYYDTVEEFANDVTRWGLPLLAPGEEIPERS
jgi:hypothetical protein